MSEKFFSSFFNIYQFDTFSKKLYYHFQIIESFIIITTAKKITGLFNLHIVPMIELSYKGIKETDKELYDLLIKEKKRQQESIELIASESYVTTSVLHASASLTHNKYSEGTINARYYGGTNVIDEIESLCQKRALKLFDLDEKEWGVNVQPYSGSIANFEVYNALIGKNGKLMGMDLFSGGHLSHGFQLDEKRKISVTAKYFQSFPYKVDEDGNINYDEMEKIFIENKVQLLVFGASAYPRDFDYCRGRSISDKNHAYFMCDMAHISGLIAYKKMNNPFKYCDIVTTTVQKMLRGPKAGIIFYKKIKNGTNIENLINKSVFPGCQGGPHNQTISGIATALLFAMSNEYSQYIDQLLKNMQAICEVLKENKVKIFANGTINHLLLIDTRNMEINNRKFSLNGSKVEYACNFVNISLNKNSIPGDSSAMNPSAIRIGTVSITCRGYKEKESREVAKMLIEILIHLEQYAHLDDSNFQKAIKNDQWMINYREKVINFAKKFPLPGADLLEKMNY